MTTRSTAKLSGSSGVSPLTRSKASVKSKKAQCTCPICDDLILEAVGKKAGDEAVECDGSCAAWLHRRCAGLSKEAYLSISKSPNPFFCPQCRLDKQELDIKALRAIVGDLSNKLSAACDDIAKLKSSHMDSDKQRQPTYANIAKPVVPQAVQNGDKASDDSNVNKPATNSQKLFSQRKFNVLMFGITENDKGTPRHIRNQNDLSSVSEVLSNLDPLVSVSSVSDCFRLGKFNDDKTRPILIKLTRSADVVSVLSNRHKLSSFPGIRLKPDLSPEERKRESLLLKERWELINNGISKTTIKIRGNNLYVSSKKYGSVRNCEFHLSPVNTPEENSERSTVDLSVNKPNDEEQANSVYTVFSPSRSVCQPSFQPPQDALATEPLCASMVVNSVSDSAESTTSSPIPDVPTVSPSLK